MGSSAELASALEEQAQLHVTALQRVAKRESDEAFGKWVELALMAGGKRGHRFTRQDEVLPPITEVQVEGEWVVRPDEVMSWRCQHWTRI